MNVDYLAPDKNLTVTEFIVLFHKVWKYDLDLERTQSALKQSINVSARSGGGLVACCRIITDGYLFASIAEVLVHPDWRGSGVSIKLLDLAYECSPSHLIFGTQQCDDKAMQQIGWSRGPNAYFRLKDQSVDFFHSNPT